MKKIIYLFVLLSHFSLYGQEFDDSKFITTESGLKYQITEKGRGIKAQKTDKVTVHYVGKLEDGTVFDSSIERKQPFTFALGTGSVIKGWDEGIELLHQGDKATLIIPPDLGYGSQTKGNIPANSTLIFNVELLNVQKEIQVEAFDTTNITPVVTESGLKYFVINEADKKAKRPEKNERVVVHYTGYFKDGKIFDSSVKRGETIKFELGINQVIAGWEEGLSYMKKGEKYRLIVPYQLAYGESGRPPMIPAKSDLIFDIELIDILPEIKVEPYNIKGKKEYTTESGIKYYIIEETNNSKADKNQTVTVQYSGFLEDGTLFDSSIKREMPFSFQVGSGRVIKGWDEGVLMMKVGEKFRFILPPELAYGDKGVSPIIPPNATLIFDIELLKAE